MSRFAALRKRLPVALGVLLLTLLLATLGGLYLTSAPGSFGQREQQIWYGFASYIANPTAEPEHTPRPLNGIAIHAYPNFSAGCGIADAYCLQQALISTHNFYQTANPAVTAAKPIWITEIGNLAAGGSPPGSPQGRPTAQAYTATVLTQPLLTWFTRMRPPAAVCRTSTASPGSRPMTVGAIPMGRSRISRPAICSTSARSPAPSRRNRRHSSARSSVKRGPRLRAPPARARGRIVRRRATMFQRYSGLFGLALLALGLFPIPAMVDQTPPLPVCQPWAGVPQLRPSPAISQDDTLLSVSGYPLGQGLTYGGLKSTDRGITWQQFDNPGNGQVLFSSNYIVDHALAVMPWPFAQAHFPPTAGPLARRHFPRADPNAFALGDAQHLYLGYGREIPPEQRVSMELQMSSDGGQSWQRTYQGLEIDEIAVSPAFAQDHTLLMALGLYHYNGGIIKSTDAGLTWTQADAGINLEGFGMAACASRPPYATDWTLFSVNPAPYAERIYKEHRRGRPLAALNNPLIYPSSRPELLLSPRYQQDQTLWYVSYYGESSVATAVRRGRLCPMRSGCKRPPVLPAHW